MKKSFILFLGTFVILALLIVGGFAFLSKEQPMPQVQSPTPSLSQMNQGTPLPRPTPTVQPSPDPTANWKTYRNEEFELQYPEEWFVYDLEKFKEDDKNGACYPSGPSGIENRVIFSMTDLGTCVTYGISAHVGDLEISVFPREYKEMLNNGSGFKEETILLDGVKAIKFSPLEHTVTSSNEKSMSINANYKGRYYNIFFKQTNPVFDQILSTFHFLD